MSHQTPSGALGPRRDDSGRIQKTESAADRMAALKARVAAAIGTSKAKGGLNIGLHPALEDLGSWKPPSKAKDSPQDQARWEKATNRSPIGVQSGTAAPGAYTKSPGIGTNPYYDEKLAAQEKGGRQRESRRLVFNQKGKYIQQGNALRRQAALEAMKKRIAEQTRRAGIDEDLDVEKNFVVDAPPAIEWWDEGLVDGTSYDDIEDPNRLKISVEDSIVTEYIQHPVALDPPQEKNTSAAKPMYLTSKEQAKIRRQRRMAALKEMQAKIRLGLVPAPPPKVKKGNLMRVLGDAAVKDPTAVEARVNREIAERRDQHLEANEARKLTKEQKHDKLAANQEKDAEKGVRVMVFKVNSLANGQHRYKVWRNADQLALTGTCIMHPKFSLIIVEGGEWSINKYKKLMLNRINWIENSPSRDRDATYGTSRDWLSAEDANGALKDMSMNECKLIFEGEQKIRGFKKWGSKVCETDAEARDVLTRAKMDSFWSLAKGMS